jgi:hypothetical protein
MQTFLNKIKDECAARWGSKDALIKWMAEHISSDYGIYSYDYYVVKTLPVLEKKKLTLELPKTYTDEQELSTIKEYEIGFYGKDFGFGLLVFNKVGNIHLTDSLLLVHNTNGLAFVNIESIPEW